MPGGDYTKVVKRLRPEAQKPGNIEHVDGRVLGTHEGIIHYTIGQRKGLGIGGGHSDNNDPFYVVKVDAANARVIVGPKEALARDTIELKDCNWLDGDHKDVLLKFRSMMQPIRATLTRHDDGSATLRVNDPQYGISPGQAAVCYDGERMIGGGWISAASHSNFIKAA